MDIQKKINEIGDYFKKQIITGNYEFIKPGLNFATIKVDETFELKIWTGGEMPKYLQIFEGFLNNTYLSDFGNFTPKEKAQIWDVLKVRIAAYNKEIGIKEKQAEVDKLLADIKSMLP